MLVESNNLLRLEIYLSMLPSSADPCAFRRLSTTDALADAAPSLFTLKPIHTPAAVLCVGKKYAAAKGIKTISVAEKIAIIEEITVD